MRVFGLLTCLLVTILSSCIAPPCSGAHGSKKPKKSAKELKHQLHSVRAQIQKQRLAIKKTRRTEHEIVLQIQTVEDRITRTETHLKQASARILQLAIQQKALKARIAATQRRLDARKAVLARRLRENYERGNPNYVQVLLRSRSVHEYVSRSYYVERIVDTDVKLVDGIRFDRKELETDQHTLDAQANELKGLCDALKAEKAEYKQDVGKKRELLNEVAQEEHDDVEALQELEDSSNEIEARLRAIQLTPAGHARLLIAWTGHFTKPADGRITSGFGSRYHPILHRVRRHTGVDIGAGYGSSIHAAADGEIVMSGSMRGYGNVVIIDHGGGVSTLYGHCSALLVSEGQKVRQGDVIARVGSTGLATGPHLHWEVRHNGVPVNPLSSE